MVRPCDEVVRRVPPVSFGAKCVEWPLRFIGAKPPRPVAVADLRVFCHVIHHIVLWTVGEVEEGAIFPPIPCDVMACGRECDRRKPGRSARGVCLPPRPPGSETTVCRRKIPWICVEGVTIFRVEEVERISIEHRFEFSRAHRGNAVCCLGG